MIIKSYLNGKQQILHALLLKQQFKFTVYRSTIYLRFL